MFDDERKEVLKTTIQLTAANSEKNSELGVTQKYDRKLYDNETNKRKYKDKKFNGNKTYHDKISGKTLHRSSGAAKKKYHTKWAKHSAETDHINALKNVHDVAKHNPFLKDSDLKEILNSDENYRLFSKSDNTSKKDKNDWQIVFNPENGMSLEGRTEMAKQKINADTMTHIKFAEATAKNVSAEFGKGAVDTLLDSVVPLTAEAVSQMVQVAQGEKNLEEAAKDTGKAILKTAVIGGTERIMMQAVTNQLAASQNPVLNSISATTVGQIITVAVTVQESAVRYINGEINGEEFIAEVGMKGTMMVAGMIGREIGGEIGTITGSILGSAAMPFLGTGAGAVLGRVVGEILGTLITTVACGAIMAFYNVKKHMDDYKLKEKQIRRLESAALSEMEVQRIKFREIVQREYRVWDDTIKSGFDQILTGACEATYSLQGITDGLDKILSLFGKNVAFKTLEEYENQLDMPLKLSF